MNTITIATVIRQEIGRVIVHQGMIEIMEIACSGTAETMEIGESTEKSLTFVAIGYERGRGVRHGTWGTRDGMRIVRSRWQGVEAGVEEGGAGKETLIEGDAVGVDEDLSMVAVRPRKIGDTKVHRRRSKGVRRYHKRYQSRYRRVEHPFRLSPERTSSGETSRLHAR